MDSSPASPVRRARNLVERKLDELSASLHGALSPSGPRSPGEERRLVKEIKKKTYFLRFLIVAEGESHGGAPPAYLAEAEARFGVLKASFDRWARRVVAGPAPAAEEEEDMEGLIEEEDGCSGSECSCTESCQEVAAAGDAEVEVDRVALEALVDVTTATDKKCDSIVKGEDAVAVEKKRDADDHAVLPLEENVAADSEIAADRVALEPPTVEVTPDAIDKKCDSVVTREDVTPPAAVAIAKKKRDTEHEAVVRREEPKSEGRAKKRDAENQGAAGSKRVSTVQRRWWSRGAAWCGAAGVVAVVAVGLAVEFAAVAHHNVSVYVVPT